MAKAAENRVHSLFLEPVFLPEFPDITVYIEALAERLDGAVLHGIRLASLFVLRTAVPEIGDRKSTRLNSSHSQQSRMPSSA